MLKLDHLTIIAPSLEIGAAHVRDQLGMQMQVGGRHPQMGTHNLLLRLGDDVFLEVIAVDPAAALPHRARWFGLDDADTVQSEWEAGKRLRGWVAQTRDLDVALAAHGPLLGEKTRVSRGDRSWEFAVPRDGALPAGGAAPSVIDWGDRRSPAPAMADHGARLLSFHIEHPDAAWVSDLYARLDVATPPEVHRGERIRYRAIIDTPGGIKELF